MINSGYSIHSGGLPNRQWYLFDLTIRPQQFIAFYLYNNIYKVNPKQIWECTGNEIIYSAGYKCKWFFKTHAIFNQMCCMAWACAHILKSVCLYIAQIEG